MASVKLSALALIAAANITAADIVPMTDADAGTPTTYKMTLAQLRTSLLQQSVGAGWGATDYLGLGSGAAPASGMIRSGQGVLAGASSPFINSAVTWNNGATAFTHVLVNVTNTASNAASLLMDLQAGAGGVTSMWKVTALGAVTQAAGLTVTTGGITVSAGTTAVQALTATTGVFSDNISVAPTKRVSFDGGGNTYVQETSDDVLALNVGGQAITITKASNLVSLGAWSTSFSQGAKHYLDGGAANNYIWSSAANVVQIVAGGAVAFSTTSALITTIAITSTGALTGTSIAASASNGSINLRDQGATAVEAHIRPNAGKNGWVTFTENAVADRWLIGIKPADSALYFATGNPGSFTLQASITSAGVMNIVGGYQCGSGATVTKWLSNTLTWNPSDVSTLQSTTCTVTGAAVGDLTMIENVWIADNAAACLRAYVSSADTVTVWLNTLDGSLSTYANRTTRIWVVKF